MRREGGVSILGGGGVKALLVKARTWCWIDSKSRVEVRHNFEVIRNMMA